MGIPTVGAAKTLYHVDGIEKNEDHQNKVCMCFFLFTITCACPNSPVMLLSEQSLVLHHLPDIRSMLLISHQF